MGALPSFTYLALALAALAAAGLLLVWIIRYTGRRDDGNPKGRPVAPATVATPPAFAEPTLTEERELLRVARTDKGVVAVFVQGQRYHRLQEIKDPQVGCETIEALKAVLTFAEGWLPLRQATAQAVARKSTVDEEAFLEQLRSRNLFSAGNSSRLSPSEPLIPVEVINNMVQERLRKRPDLAAQRIYMATESRGNLRIYVGMQSFEAVDEIPNTEVRALIQDAIHEWEST
jgi:hypothetical protein